MPPAKKARAAVTGRAANLARGKQAADRNALAEKPGNVQEGATRSRGVKRPASDYADALQEDNAGDEPKPGRGRRKGSKAQKIPTPDDEDELSQVQIEPTAPEPVKRGRKPKVPVEAEIPETQQAEIEIPETQYADAADMNSEDEPTGNPSTHRQQEIPSVQRHLPRSMVIPGRRPVSASDSEMSDPTLRRRIGDLTRKHDVLEVKYRDLREIGIIEAERNFDRLKKQSEERANGDKQLIAALKTQLSGETEIAKDAEQLRKQLEDSQKKVEELQAKLDGLHGTLTEAKTEIKTLSTKLTAARSAESTSIKVPGSAMKNGHAGSRHVASAAEAAAQLAQTKENLYGDLTGLLVCGVKRENGEEVFDCVQTGKNGTLHFKLSIAADGSPDKFEDAQFMYMPQLDAARDEELIDTLPDYLVEEITFPRFHAAKFYSRVVKALTEGA
ncbi:chromosome segregation protein Csm1/Pcs1-domain-containing protein [Nemania sp. FL0916]|nr:chromosome segregation protein Csm1/Pcs1-domain-containing protein [Nemania sp. FL0916]